MEYDTIAAVATGMLPAGISIIRISGEKAFEIADRIFVSRSGRTVSEMKSFTVSYGNIRDLDEVLLIKMAAPSTYTREDVVEIDCHGGIAVTKAVLDLIISNGARLAEPGEFTKRAFLNGRIDLSQAEAVSDLIASESESSIKNSMKQLNGELRGRISKLRDELITKSAYIEAALDDPEHIELSGFSDKMSETVNEACLEIKKLINSYESGRIIKNGINTVIFGLANVGKSSLMNRILGTDRAIVTDIAGTTRDTLSESALIGGIMLNLTDTAGIRETDDVIEKIGVDRARDAAENADLILFVKDVTAGGFDEEEINILRDIVLSGNKKLIMIINKTDIEKDLDQDAYVSDIYGHCGISEDICRIPVIFFSAKTGQGMEDLEKCIKDLFFSGNLKYDDELYITSTRHKALLADALKSLENVNNAIKQGLSEDFYTIDLMDAATSLGRITGENVEDELANKIFSEFCLGK